MKVDLSLILQIMGGIFIILMVNYLLYSTLGVIYVKWFTMALIITPIYLLYKLIKKITK